MRVVVGLSSGIGNTCFMLPLIKQLHDGGDEVVLYMDGDSGELPALWRRCAWASEVIDGKRRGFPPGDRYVSGHWCPPGMVRAPGLIHHQWLREDYGCTEWQLALGGDASIPLPDVTDWCTNLDLEMPQWDVGIVAGCKGGIWERKRYMGMRAVVDELEGLGYRCAQFGLPEDSEDLGIDDQRGKWPLARLPNALAVCSIVIGTDSGPTHLASSLGVPTVLLYTATSSIKGDPVGRPTVKLHNGVPCRPCQGMARWAGCTDWICRAIDPRRVVGAALSLLGGSQEAVAQ